MHDGKFDGQFNEMHVPYFGHVYGAFCEKELQCEYFLPLQNCFYSLTLISKGVASEASKCTDDCGDLLWMLFPPINHRICHSSSQYLRSKMLH